MKKRFLLPISIGIALATFWGHTSCTVEDLDVDDLNTDSLYIQSAVDLPVAHVWASLENIIKHTACKGKIVTPDYTIPVQESVYDSIPYPINILEGTYIEESDSFMYLNFDDKIGEGKAINYLEECELKVTVDNGMPLSVDYNLIFLHQDSVTGVISEIPELCEKNFFKAEPGKLDKESKTIKGNAVTKHNFTYGNEFTEALKKVNHIKVDYRFHLDEYNNVILTGKERINMNVSCYFKGGILVNEYNF